MQPRVLVPVTNPLGGIRTYMLYNMKHLHGAGFRFTFLSERGELFERFKKDVADWDGTDFEESPSGGGSLAMLRTVRAVLAQRQFSLIHSQGLAAGTVVSAANYFRRVPHLMTLHDVIVPMNDIPGRFKWLKKKVAAFVTRRANVIVPVSKDCEMNHRTIFPSWNRGPVRIQTIRNGIDVEKIVRSHETALAHPETMTLRSDLKLNEGTLLGGFFGRFMPQKGFDYLVEALAILARRGYENRFHLVATADENGFQREYMDAVRKNPAVASMVSLVPTVGDIAPLLTQVDVLVMPSLWEACGLLAMEAMVLGVPVIGSDCLGLREILAGTPSSTPQHANASSLAEALMAFIENPSPEPARQYQETARKNFDVQIAVDALLELYREIAR